MVTQSQCSQLCLASRFFAAKSLPIKREGGSITKWVFGVSNFLSFFTAKTDSENAIIGPTNFGAHIAHKSFDQKPELNDLSFSRPLSDEKWSNIPNSVREEKLYVWYSKLSFNWLLNRELDQNMRPQIYGMLDLFASSSHTAHLMWEVKQVVFCTYPVQIEAGGWKTVILEKLDFGRGVQLLIDIW